MAATAIDSLNATLARCQQARPPARAYAATFADTEGGCPNWLGLLKGPAYRFRRPLVPVCSSTRGSSIRCVPDDLRKGATMLICDVENVQVGQFEKFDPVIGAARPALQAACTWERHLGNATRNVPWKARTGSVRLRSLEPVQMRRQDGGEMHPEDGRLTAEGYMALFNSIRVDEAAQYACDWDARLVDYPVVLIPRRDAYNPFYGHETLLALWSTYLARGLDPCDTGVLLSDYFDDRSGSVSSGASSRSPMFELIARVFAPVRGVERVADVGARLCATCYRRLIVAIDPIDNFEIPYYQEDGHKGSLSPCGHSPWLMGFARFSLAGFGLEHGARPERTVPHVTLLARRPYQREVWNPEPFDTMRVMANRQELGHAIARLCRSIPSPDGPSAAAETRRCTASLEVDMATLPLHEQVGTASATDVLIGTHGAPFTWMIYMPSHAHVLEVRTSTDFHYKNMASYLGLKYVSLSAAGGEFISHTTRRFTVDVPRVLAEIETALNHTSGSVRKALQSGWARQAHPPAPLWPRQVEWQPAEPDGGSRVPSADLSPLAWRTSLHDVDPRAPNPKAPRREAAPNTEPRQQQRKAREKGHGNSDPLASRRVARERAAAAAAARAARQRSRGGHGGRSESV